MLDVNQVLPNDATQIRYRNDQQGQLKWFKPINTFKIDYLQQDDYLIKTALNCS